MSRRRRSEPQEPTLFADYPLDHATAPDEPAADRSRTPTDGSSKAPERRIDPALAPPAPTTASAAPDAPDDAPPPPFQPSLFDDDRQVPRAPLGADRGSDDPAREARSAEDDGHEPAEEPSEPDAAATLGDRLLAGVADIAVHVVMLGAAIGAVTALGVPITTDSWPGFAVLVLAFSFLYWVVPLAFWGQTPGMAWIGHIARGGNDEPLSFGQTVRRWLGAWLTVGLIGLPLLLALGGRSLSDRLSGTDTHPV